MGPGEDERGDQEFPEQMGDISDSDTGYPDQSYGSTEYGGSNTDYPDQGYSSAEYSVSDTGYLDQGYGSAEYNDEEDSGSDPNVMGGGGSRTGPKPKPTPEEIVKAKEIGKCKARCEGTHTAEIMLCGDDERCRSIADNVLSRCKTRCQDEPYHNAPL